MLGSPRIDEVISLLEAYALGELAVPKKRIKAAIKLLDMAIPDAPSPDDGAEVLRSVFAFPSKLAS